MRLSLVTPPAVEPITLAEAKDQLYIEQDFDAADDLISEEITTARGLCEVKAEQSFVSTVWDLYLDSFPGLTGGYFNRQIRQAGPGPNWLPRPSLGVIEFPRSPLISVETIEYRDALGELVTLDPSVYRVSAGPAGRVQPRTGQTWPATSSEADSVRIRFTAGYGADASAVPSAAKKAIKLVVSHLHENRGEANAELPDTASHLLASISHGYHA